MTSSWHPPHLGTTLDHTQPTVRFGARFAGAGRGPAEIVALDGLSLSAEDWDLAERLEPQPASVEATTYRKP